MPKRTRDPAFRQAFAEWNALIDDLVAWCDSEEAGRPHDYQQDWDPTMYLPVEHPITENIRALVAASQAEHSESEQQIYRPRFSARDLFHAQPKRPSEVDIFSKRKVELYQTLPPLDAPEGPDFSDFIRLAHIDDVERNLTAVGAMITPQRGLIGTAVTPLVTPLRFNEGLVRKVCDFDPIIIVPNSLTAILQIWNAEDFLVHGQYHEAALRYTRPDGTASITDPPESITVSPSTLLPTQLGNYNIKFRQFRVVCRAESVDNWDHVCACIVTGQKWQLEDWYGGDKKKTDPSTLFSNVRGFMPYFEEDKPPETIDMWRVFRLQLSRKLSKAYAHIQAATTFWEETFRFMETHPNFRQYTLAAS